MEFQSFLLSQVAPDSITPRVVESFERLEPDEVRYNTSEFCSRFRRFSPFAYDQDGQLERRDDLENLFNDRRPFHSSHADRPPPMEDEIAGSDDFLGLLEQVFCCLPIDLREYAVGVNQIHVVADDDNLGSTAPSLHQDGYDFSCHLVVGRRNVSGGASLVATAPAPDQIILDEVLEAGHFVFFNDRALYHTATPVACRVAKHGAARDMMILDFARVLAR